MKTIATLSLQLRLTLLAVILFVAAGQHAAAQTTESSAAVTPSLLLSFNGQVENNSADLTWVMENETNCKWFVIERSGEEGGYDSISVVTGVNNNNQTTYTFSDQHMLNGNNYYRLRQVDRDGIVRYSKIVTLYKNVQTTSAHAMGVYPNPATSTISYTVPSMTAQQVLVQIYDISGVVLLTAQQQLNTGNNQQTIALSSL
ncbi:MAG TPA: T9SS type A sorting domain-containing protein, partial [Puia sp.]|nr:T9SS type A sorting domain-containing protein [Puia sp.]